MTTISAKIIADSIGESAPRLTTLHLRYPRMIHSEIMTHRVFSRNARSSRAVPIETMIREIETDPVIPLHWGAAQKGMQADNETCNPVRIADGGFLTKYEREGAWLRARDEAVKVAKGFADAGYHKQVVNRLVEPFMHIDTLVTSSEWSNFFALRDHPAAEPHIRMLAQAIRKAMDGSKPKRLAVDHWHLPYADDKETEAAVARMALYDADAELALRRISVARCARISYKPFDGDAPSIEADLRLEESLRASGHWSPFEHQAMPDHYSDVLNDWSYPEDHRNFIGWHQNRRMIERETSRAA